MATNLGNDHRFMIGSTRMMRPWNGYRTWHSAADRNPFTSKTWFNPFIVALPAFHAMPQVRSGMVFSCESRFRPGACQEKDAPQQSLSDARLKQALDGSERPYIHETLHKGLGLTGKGVKVGIIEHEAPKDELDSGLDQNLDDHGERTVQVLSGIGEFKTGVAPNAEQGYYPFKGFDIQLPKDEKADLGRYVTEFAASSVQAFNKTLKAAMTEPGRKPQILNASLNISHIYMANQLETLLDQTHPDNAEQYLYPALRKALYGSSDESPTAAQKQQATLDFVKGTLAKDVEQNGRFNRALVHYQDTTRQLAKAGINLVIAAGNDHDAFRPGVWYSPADETNFFSLSDDVITVGSSNTNQTPGNQSDDKPSAFSSQGRVTLMAPGENIPVLNGKTGDIDLVSGSSYAAPYVAGLIGLMLEANPSLTPSQVKQILLNTAVKPGSDSQVGFTSPEDAVLEALSSLSSSFKK